MSSRTPVLIALGANVGDPVTTVLRTMDRLTALSSRPLRRSSLWRSAPVECPEGSPPFVNAAVAITPLPGETPESLLEKLQSIEREFGRQPPRVLNEPRTLDLDLVAFGAERRCAPRLVLPHPRAHQRRFVLQPLAEIVPGFVLPGQTRDIAGLLAALPTGEKVIRLLAGSNQRASGGQECSGQGADTD